MVTISELKNYKNSINDYNLRRTQKKPELALIVHMQFKHQYIDMWTSFQNVTYNMERSIPSAMDPRVNKIKKRARVAAISQNNMHMQN